MADALTLSFTFVHCSGVHAAGLLLLVRDPAGASREPSRVRMKWASWCLAVVMVTLSSGWLALVAQFWVLRKKFEIAARSPMLLIISAVTVLAITDSVLVHWLLQTVGKRLPCAAISWISHSAYVLTCLPYCIRAVRVVVVYNREYRVKYVRFVKKKPMLYASTAISVALTVRAAIYYSNKPSYYSSFRGEQACFYWNDLVLTGSLIVVFGVPLFFLGLQLVKIKDAFKLGEEIVRVTAGSILCLASVTVIQILVIYKLLPDSRQVHLAGEFFVLMWGMNAGFWGLLVPMGRVHRHNHWNWFTYAVFPAEDDAVIGATSGTTEVLKLARNGGDMGDRFAEFARENLCMESWDFIVDAVRYEKEPTGSDDQFQAYLHITSQYLLPTSPDEVNISSTMSKRMLAFRTRDAFSSLDEEGRRTILDEPLNEIVRMLEQNLLQKFRRLVALQDGEPRAIERTTEYQVQAAI